MSVDGVMTYRRSRWFVLLTLAVATAAMQAVMISFAPLMGVIAESLNADLAFVTAATMGGFNLASAIFTLMGGYVCDRFGVPRAFFFGLLTMLIPTLALPWVGDNLTAVLVIRVLQAVGVGPILAAVSPVAALWFPPTERGIVTGFQGAFMFVGIAFGLGFAPAMYNAVGSWQLAMAWMCVLPGFGLALSAMFLFGPKPVLAGEGAAAPNSAEVEGGSDFKNALRSSALWIAVGIDFCFVWIFVAFNNLIPTYLAMEAPVGAGYGPMAAGKYMMGFQFAAIIGSLAAGFVSAKFFKGIVKVPILMGFVLFAIFDVALRVPAVFSDPRWLVVCLSLAGFFASWVVPNLLAFVALQFPAGITGKLVGIIFAIGIFGGVLGVFAGSAALHETGTYRLAIDILGIVSLCGIVPTLFLKQRNVLSAGEGDLAVAANGEV